MMSCALHSAKYPPPTATYFNTEMLEMRLLSIQYVTLKEVKGPGDFILLLTLSLVFLEKAFAKAQIPSELMPF